MTILSLECLSEALEYRKIASFFYVDIEIIILEDKHSTYYLTY